MASNTSPFTQLWGQQGQGNALTALGNLRTTQQLGSANLPQQMLAKMGVTAGRAPAEPSPRQEAGFRFQDILRFRELGMTPGDILRRWKAHRLRKAINANWYNLGSRNKWTPERIAAARQLLSDYPEETPLSRQEAVQWRLEALDDYKQRLAAGEEPGDLAQFLEDRYDEMAEQRRLELAAQAQEGV